MPTRIVLVCCAFACVQICGVTNARAQCASSSVGLHEMVLRDGVAAVFLGTVRGIDDVGVAETVTFDVERVWKGAVKKVTTIYRPRPARVSTTSVGATIFDRGNAYVVIADRLSAA